MYLTNPRISQISNTARDWYARFIDAVDTRDLEMFASFVHDECVVHVNDNLPVYGKTALMDSMARYYTAFGEVEHELLNFYGSDEHFAAELLCHYTPQGGARVTMPAAAIYDRDSEGLIVSVRIYVGAGPMVEAFTGARG